MTGPKAWEDRRLEDEGWLRADFGDLTLLVRSTVEEWRVAALTGEERNQSDDIDGSPSDDLPWERWDRDPSDTTLRFRPVFPDRPMIIRPRAPLHLSARSRATFYVGIPAWIQLAADVEGASTVLRTWPSHQLSNTWHGSPVRGTLCYAAKTRARRKFSTESWLAHDIVCTIEISNQSAKSLTFERLFFNTDHLAVFGLRERLWSNHARIRVGENDEDLSGVVFAPRPLNDKGEAIELCPPRLGHVRRSKLSRAFSTVLSTLQDD